MSEDSRNTMPATSNAAEDRGIVEFRNLQAQDGTLPHQRQVQPGGVVKKYRIVRRGL